MNEVTVHPPEAAARMIVEKRIQKIRERIEQLIVVMKSGQL